MCCGWLFIGDIECKVNQRRLGRGLATREAEDQQRNATISLPVNKI